MITVNPPPTSDSDFVACKILTLECTRHHLLALKGLMILSAQDRNSAMDKKVLRLCLLHVGASTWGWNSMKQLTHSLDLARHLCSLWGEREAKFEMYTRPTITRCILAVYLSHVNSKEALGEDWLEIWSTVSKQERPMGSPSIERWCNSVMTWIWLIQSSHPNIRHIDLKLRSGKKLRAAISGDHERSSWVSGNSKAPLHSSLGSSQCGWRAESYSDCLRNQMISDQTRFQKMNIWRCWPRLAIWRFPFHLRKTAYISICLASAGESLAHHAKPV